MTCIVGIETEAGVLMGADSASTSGWDISAVRSKKVFARGDFLIGYTTSFRMGQLLEYRLSVKEQKDGQPDFEYMATSFIDAVRQCLEDGRFLSKKDDREEGGQFLVGYRGALYEINADFSVLSPADGLASVGYGYSYALGSLWGSADLEPRERINLALRAADHFCNGVCGPFYVVEGVS